MLSQVWSLSHFFICQITLHKHLGDTQKKSTGLINQMPQRRYSHGDRTGEPRVTPQVGRMCASPSPCHTSLQTLVSLFCEVLGSLRTLRLG